MIRQRIAPFLILIVGASITPGFAVASDPLGFYIGGAVGKATVKVDQLGTGVPLDFDTHHIGWKALFGVRPLSVSGAEFEYVYLGHPSTVIGNNVKADAQVRGPAIFALGYLPLPLPLLDVYGKVGLARLQTTATASLIAPPGVACFRTNPIPFTCGPEELNRTDIRFAWGAGVQMKLSRIAVRGEYERFTTSAGNPDFLSIGITWSF